MRPRALLAIPLLGVALLVPCIAQDSVPTQKSIDDLAARASQAQPRQQCFLYAQLVHQMAELSVRQYSAGDVDSALASLHGIQQFAQKIHLSLSNDDKRLKNAEILLNQTAFRLHEMLQSSSFEDRPVVEATLAQVSHAQDEALNQFLRVR
jgi:hypothetical protein